MSVESASDLAVFFDADAGFGIAASYVPPAGGTGTACVILVDDTDLERQGFQGQPVRKGKRITVRVSEIASPAAGGRFVTAHDDFVIVGAPSLEVADRQLWSCVTG